MITLPLQERPRERLLQSGAEALSNAELLAILLGSGIPGKSVIELAQEVLIRFGGLEGVAEATVKELCTINGVGLAKAIQVKAAVALGLRASRHDILARARIDTPQQAYELLRMLSYETREHFTALLLDTKNGLIAQETIAIGTLSHVLVHPREVFYPAIRHKAATLILAHNHPSGDPTPSSQDRALTQALIDASKLLDIPLRDHIIIGNSSFISLREMGMKFA